MYGVVPGAVGHGSFEGGKDGKKYNTYACMCSYLVQCL